MIKPLSGLILLSILFASSAFSQTIEKQVSIPALSEGASRYFYVPFDVPPGVHSLSISYSYEKKDGENVVDLGLFDPDFDADQKSVTGFRGWSGGRRETIFVSETIASNGYLAGPIRPGEWRVILGLYKIAPEGVEISIRVKLNNTDEKAAAERSEENGKVINFVKGIRPRPLGANGLIWYRGDLHMHSFNSDGHWTIRELLDYAEANDLDFIGVTDHNTTAHHQEIDRLARSYPDLLVLLGEEVTTYGGHFNVWGLKSGTLIDFRISPGDSRKLSDVVRGIHAIGLPASINHPAALCGGCSWTYGDDWKPMDSVEIWNGAWDATDEIALAKWDILLRKGSRITAIGSSDSHAPRIGETGSGSPIGLPTTSIGAEKLNVNTALNALLRHRVYVTENPRELIAVAIGAATIGDDLLVKPNTSSQLSLRADNFPDHSVIKVIVGGRVIKESAMENGSFQASVEVELAADTYLRVEIRDSRGRMLGFTNPIFTKAK